MPLISSDARFLGVDLAVLWRDMRAPWRRMHQWPLFEWLTPLPYVLVARADGSQQVWEGDLRPLAPGRKVSPQFYAVELPDDYVLRRTMALPEMTMDDAEAAMALEAKTSSPFDASDLVWGHGFVRSLAGGGKQIELAMASRKQVAQFLAGARTTELAQGRPIELWVMPSQGLPILLSGYGEAARASYCTRRRRWGYTLSASFGLGLIALAITPTLQLRSRAIEAVLSFDQVVRAAAPAVQQREQLMASADSLTALSELTNGRIEPLKVLDKLTQTLPDDTAIQGIKLQGNKLIMNGHTANASALMQLLGDVPGFKEVRSPAATTKVGNGKETFAAELLLDPQVYGVKSAQLEGVVAAPAVQSASDTSATPPVVSTDPTAVTSPQQSGSAPVGAAASPAPVPKSAGAAPGTAAAAAAAITGSAGKAGMPAAQAPAANASGARPSFGGRPAFGGGATKPASPASATGGGTPAASSASSAAGDKS